MIPTDDLRALDRRAVHLIRSIQPVQFPDVSDLDVSGVAELEDRCPVLRMIRRPSHAECYGEFPSVQLVRTLRRWHLHTHLHLGRGWGFVNEMAVIEDQLDSIEPVNRSGHAVWFLVRALLTGPVYMRAMEPGVVVGDLAAFARLALDAGLPVAVLSAIEAGRQEPVAADELGKLGDQLAEFIETPNRQLVRPSTSPRRPQRPLTSGPMQLAQPRSLPTGA